MRYLPRPYGGAVGPIRLLTLIGLMCVVGMLIYRARDASTWRWLGREDTKEEVIDAEVPAEPATGVTDTDSAEWDAVNEEFLAIADRSLELGKEEMPAYWRLLGWVNRQPLSLLRSRTRETPALTLNDLMLHPDKNRGKLARMKLNVRRVLEYKAPENPDGFQKLYELWGFTDDSQAWLYVVVTPELPPGMPIGNRVGETAWVYGYFLKLQGYYRAGANPNEKKLEAPLFVGRVDWHASASTAAKPDLPPLIWIGIALAAAVICAGSVAGFVLFSKGKSKPKSVPSKRSTDPQEVSSWLSEASQNSEEPAVIHLKANGHEREGNGPESGSGN